MTPKDVLIAAKALIDTPEKWTKNAFARDVFGFSVFAFEPQAVCFCSVGAITLASSYGSSTGMRLRIAAKKILAENIAHSSIGDWNDDEDTTHAEVMAMFDDAIARA